MLPTSLTFEQIVVICGGLTIIAGAVTMLWKAYKRAPTLLDGLAERRVGDKAEHAVIQAIMAEFRPNGGSTMRDKIDGIADSQHRTEAGLERLQAQGVADFMLSREPLWEANRDGEMIACNKAFCALVGYQTEDVLGHNWKNFLHPRELKRIEAGWQGAVNDGRDFQGQWRVIKRDGQEIYLDVWGECMRAREGGAMGWKGRVALRPETKTLYELTGGREPPKKLRVLVVDDSQDITDILEATLSRHPMFEVEVANSGGDAVQQVEAALVLGRVPHIILMDYAMHGESGVDTAHKLREMAGTGFKLFFVTGSPEKISPEEQARLHVEDIIEKPFDINAVAALILRALR